LQFDSVFLIGMNRRPAREYPLLQRLGDSLALKLPERRGEKRRSARYEAILEHHQAEEEEESKRLLYVAMTRAENRLVIQLQPRRPETGSLQDVLMHSLSAALETWKAVPALPPSNPDPPGREDVLEVRPRPPRRRFAAGSSFETSVSELETF